MCKVGFFTIDIPIGTFNYIDEPYRKHNSI